MLRISVFCITLLLSLSSVFAQNTPQETITQQGVKQFVEVIKKYEKSYPQAEIVTTIHYMIQSHFTFMYGNSSQELHAVLYSIIETLYQQGYASEITQTYSSPLGFTLLIPKYLQGNNETKQSITPKEHDEGVHLIGNEEVFYGSSFRRVAEAKTSQALEATLTDIANKNREDGHICSFIYNFDTQDSSGNIEVQMYMGNDDDEKCIRDRFDSIVRNPQAGKAVFWDIGQEPSFHIPVTLIDGTSQIVFFDSIIDSSIRFE